MERFITDERTGLKYELVGDYYLIAGDDGPEEERPIGVWGQRHLRYLKEHHRVRYANLLTKLHEACTSFRILGSYPMGPQLDRLDLHTEESEQQES